MTGGRQPRSKWKLSGSVWLLGDHINTDLIHPPDYFSLDGEKLQAGLVEGLRRIDAAGRQTLEAENIVIVAGLNFGCGSSRETSVRALRDGGVRVVLARSFGRIFFRSLVNLGIFPLHCNTVQTVVKPGMHLTVDLERGKVCCDNGDAYAFQQPDAHVLRVLQAGGLIAYLRNERGVSAGAP